MINWRILAISVCLCLAACQAVTKPGDLNIIEYPLEKIPDAESAELQTLMENLRQDPRFHLDEETSGVVTIPFCMVGERQGICATLGSDKLFAFEEFDSDGSGRVILTRNGTESYTIPVGTASPLTNLRGLWTYEDHWVLETVRVNIQQDGNQITFETVGQITQDGELLNERLGYNEAYEFQFLNDLPFYLFRRGTKIDASYNGNEVPLGYNQIIQYGCCSASSLNPIHYADHLDFFARKGESWYYIEIGVTQ